MHSRTNPPISAQVETMLDIWTKWVRKGNSNGLGYPSVSNIGKIYESGCVPIQRGGARSKCPLEEDPIAETMERWIIELKREKEIEADVLIYFYAIGWCKEKLGKIMGVSVRMIEVRLKTAKTWLEGRYAGNTEVLYF